MQIITKSRMTEVKIMLNSDTIRKLRENSPKEVVLIGGIAIGALCGAPVLFRRNNQETGKNHLSTRIFYFFPIIISFQKSNLPQFCHKIVLFWYSQPLKPVQMRVEPSKTARFSAFYVLHASNMLNRENRKLTQIPVRKN